MGRNIEGSSSEVLNQMLRNKIEKGISSREVEEIINNPNFKMDEETRKMLAESEEWEDRILAAEDEGSSSEFLNQMFRNELENEDGGDADVTEAIINNPNFKMNEEARKKLAGSDYWRNRVLVAEDERSSSEFLNQMFRNELENEDGGDADVTEAIINNSNFKMDDKTRELLAKSNYSEDRELVAKDKGSSSEFLNQNLLKEIEEGDNDDVIEAIVNNPNFKMEDGTRKKLAESDSWRNRGLAAEDEGSSSEFLNQMFRNELENENDADVIEIITNNSNFKMDDKTRELLAKSDYMEDRELAAKDEGSSSEFLNRMFQNELEDGADFDVILDVLEVINNNPNFKMDDEIREKLAESDESEYRLFAAEDEGSSLEFLSQMYQKELNGANNKKVLEAIKKNPNFKMDDETKK